MTQQETTKPVSRRGMLAGLGAGAAAVGVGASVLAGAPAEAAPGDPVLQGADNNAGAASTVLRSTVTGATLDVRNNVTSSSSTTAVKASADTGVDASGFDVGVIGVSSNGNGVIGRSEIGYGVVGTATGAGGIGVVASAPDEYGKTALHVKGQMRYNRSGRATVPAGASDVTVTGLRIYATTRAFAMVQQNAGVWATAAVPVTVSGELKLYLNAAAPVGGVLVAWWLLD